MNHRIMSKLISLALLMTVIQYVLKVKTTNETNKKYECVYTRSIWTFRNGATFENTDLFINRLIGSERIWKKKFQLCDSHLRRNYRKIEINISLELSNIFIYMLILLAIFNRVLKNRFPIQ